VVVHAPPELARLFASLEDAVPPGRLTVEPDPARPGDCAARVSVMSLPRLLGTTAATIPAAVPYLAAAPGLVAQWRARLAGAGLAGAGLAGAGLAGAGLAGAGPRIGIVWAGRRTPDPNRTTELGWFVALAESSDVRFLSLQLGPEQAEARGDHSGRIVDVTAGIADFADTAAILAGLDLVITIDTALAHLAGAVGRPTWTLLPFHADWRWFMTREESPWYPTMRLFRQPAFGDWQSVFSRLGDELARFLADPRTP